MCGWNFLEHRAFNYLRPLGRRLPLLQEIQAEVEIKAMRQLADKVTADRSYGFNYLGCTFYKELKNSADRRVNLPGNHRLFFHD